MPCDPSRWSLLGVDFTSAPRRAKPITVARGRIESPPAGQPCAQAGTRRVVLEAMETCTDWAQFEALLLRPGPWLGAFDFPFGLPREAVVALDWPLHWPELVRHCAALGKAAFRATLDRYRESRPMGQRYAHRATDLPARSHSPLKLVNPPVGLMFLEGAPRLLNAGASVPGMQAADPLRQAVEAYPGRLARRITPASYKSDDKLKQTPARREVRACIVAALTASDAAAGVILSADAAQQRALIDDASGDQLDAVLALLQAAACALAGPPHYGLPPQLDPIEGWIAGCPTD